MCLVLSSITIPSSLFNFSIIYAQQGGAATSGSATGSEIQVYPYWC